MLHMRRRARVIAIVRYVRCKEHCFDIVDQAFEVGDKQCTQSSAVSDTDEGRNGGENTSLHEASDVLLLIPAYRKLVSVELALQGAHVLQ